MCSRASVLVIMRVAYVTLLLFSLTGMYYVLLCVRICACGVRDSVCFFRLTGMYHVRTGAQDSGWRFLSNSQS